LQNHRPILLAGSDAKTLFVGTHGGPLSIHRITRIIGDITQRYAGRRVTPHLHRDIFALGFLEDDPEGYLKLSKALWHSNPKTTLEAYAANFDESHGVVATEEWLERRKQKAAEAPPRKP
jgi:integrase